MSRRIRSYGRIKQPGSGPVLTSYSAAPPPTGISWAFKTSAVTGGGGSVTLGMLIGATIPSDIIVVVVSNDGAVPNGVTVAGNAATLVVSDTTGVDDLSVWSVTGVTLPAGSSNVGVSSAGTMFTVGAMVGVISGSSSPTGTGAALSASFADPFVAAQTVPNNGIGLIVMGQNGSLVGSWTNATQDTGFSRGTGTTDSFAHTALGTGASISSSYTPLGGNQRHGVMAFWGP